MTFHFIGIGGIGMSGLARILLQKGEKNVSGSDLKAGWTFDQLRSLGAVVTQGHRKENLPKDATVVVSTDIRADNPELQEAKQRHYPILHRSDVLLQLMHDHDVLAVTGTHGKTTTTALLTHVLIEAGKDPSYAVGGFLLNQNTNAQYGKGSYFVAEADESDGTFLKYPYAYAIVTNIDTDHLAHFGSIEALESAFDTFLKKASQKSRVFYCGDDKRLRRLSPQGLSYGFSDGCDLHITSTGGRCFDIEFCGRRYERVELSLMGRHNVLNASAVFGLALTLGIPEKTIRDAFISFKGTKRRLERKEAGDDYLVFDDYAHHPTEIRATLSTLRQAVTNRRLVAVFQPHRPSRMKHVLHELSGAFSDADVIVATEMYASNEPEDWIRDEHVFDTISKSHTDKCFYVFRRHQLVEGLLSIILPQDVIVFLGAGDITKASDEVASCLKVMAR
jgi:UDP-N-acetylmuramate--alanine ligase